MPRKAKHPCHHPGCHKLTEERFCEEHQKEEKAEVSRAILFLKHGSRSY